MAADDGVGGPLVDLRPRQSAGLRDRGATPRQYRYPTDHSVRQIREQHGDLAADRVTTDAVRVAGRAMLIRRHGGLVFASLRDRTGAIQLFVDAAVLGEARHREFGRLRRGDWVGVAGAVMTTRSGELSIRVESFELLATAARAPAEKHRGPTDVQTRYRERYLDLEANESTRRIFRVRHTAVSAIREYLTERGFTEVEGPVLQTIQGGAAARPFITHHNALDMDLYLRIALELHLKRLIVGGMERVFEIGRVFRNEGIDARHNPEFTMLEAYQAFADYTDVMDLVEGLVTHAARAALGEDLLVRIGDREIDLTPPWPRVRMADLITKHTGAHMHPGMPLEQARAVLDTQRVRYEQSWGAGRLMTQLYDEKVQHAVDGPLFCVDYPREVSPLARVHRDDPAYVERFEVIVAGFELCNAYSEQNDPAEQLAAFEAEARAKAGGDLEAGDVDLDYIRALEYGMPPTGGLGIGIDRLVMLLAGADSIREVILFPTLRPEFAPAPRAASHDAPRPVLPPTPVPRPAVAATAPPRSPSRWPVRAIAAFTAAGGLLELLAVLPFLHARGRMLLPYEVAFGPVWFEVAGRVTTLITGLLLILLAGQLAKQKRNAWRIAVGLFAVALLAHAVKGPHLVAGVFCLAMLVALILTRHRFRAPPDPPSLLDLTRFVPIYLTAVLAFGFTGLYLERNYLNPPLTFTGGLVTILSGLIGVDGPYDYLRPRFGDFFTDALLALGIAGLLIFVLLLFRPLRLRRPHTDDDWSHARRLVYSYGWDTLAYFSLRDDKSFFFGSDGEAMLAYTYLGGYALVSGDPIGAPESVPRMLDEFLAMCQQRAWNPAFLAIREADFPLYALRGFRSFYLGDEAIMRCDTFSLDGPQHKSLRAAVRRVARGYRFQLIAESNAPARLVEQLNAISRRWRGKNPERGFTMSLSQDIKGEGANPEFLLCVAIDADGNPGGFLRLVPAYGPDFGYTLDLMRHDPDAPNGMTEFLLVSSAMTLRDRGVVRLSMNFAVWGRLFAEDLHQTPAQRAARHVVGALNPFFQIKSLRDFNAKFDPQWLPRVLAYRRPTDLARVGLLYVGAEGFLAVPGIGELLVPKTVGGVASPSSPDAE
ncbi:MAG TPA: lysine--tRNA ligase [Pseudonocardiaceae bacterium]